MYRVQANRAKQPYEAKTAEEMFKTDSWPPFPTPDGDSEQHFVNENIAPLFRTEKDGESILDEKTGIDETTLKNLESETVSKASSARASWLGKKANREKLSITPADVATVDFCNGFIDFNTLQLVLPYGGLHFDLQKYWDGQPVRYVAKNLSTNDVFFVVQYVSC